ncbi:MAG: AsmA family protein [Phenylobacterium sp.]|uniref:AsmA family protein n=1 Tax=Phenylobacterium sp. TaxID=1871053 RepID=UPI0027345E83|nr:AsmA family protein [Phenylobacterium sp.]MDP3174812.1 AsmA family protein [Phenylobacterium sp.]
MSPQAVPPEVLDETSPAALAAEGGPLDSQPPEPRRRRRALYVVGGVLALVAVAVTAFLLFFDWNYARGPIGRFASARMHREVAITGDLKVHLFSWSPQATANAITIADAKWAGTGRLAEVERLTVQVRLLPLLVGRVDMPVLEIVRPKVRLLRDAQGRANWDFSDGRKKSAPLKLPPIRRFVIADGQLAYEDRKRKLTFNGVLNATEKMGATQRGFAMSGKGGLNGEPFLLQVDGGPLLNIDRSKPYPFDADLRAGPTRVTARGSITKPFDFGRFQMNLTARGPDLAELYTLTGVTLPNTPPYRLSAKMTREGRVFRFAGVSGKVGDSDLFGDLSVDNSGERPFLKAGLGSRALDFDDLASVFGGAPKVGPGETASEGQKVMAREMAAQQRFLPDATLKVDRLRAMDAEVRYRAASVRDAPVNLQSGSVTLKLDRGLLTADPVDFSLPRGRIAGKVSLNARGAVPVTDLDVRVSNARLEQLIPARNGVSPVTGALVARIKLHGAGASVHRAAAAADGEVLVVAPGGEIRQVFAELLGINVTKALGLLLSDSQQTTPIRCAVADFKVKAGVLDARNIVFDTGTVLGSGSGQINLGSETLSFRLEGKAKQPRLIRVMAPITFSGPITKPKVGVETGKAITQGGVAAALGALVNPLAAILPFIDPGLAKDAACGALIAEAGRQGAPVTKAAVAAR